MTKLTFNSVSMFKKRYCAACAANGLLAASLPRQSTNRKPQGSPGQLRPNQSKETLRITEARSILASFLQILEGVSDDGDWLASLSCSMRLLAPPSTRQCKNSSFGPRHQTKGDALPSANTGYLKRPPPWMRSLLFLCDCCAGCYSHDTADDWPHLRLCWRHSSVGIHYGRRIDRL